jgi:tRNA modification GTPase
VLAEALRALFSHGVRQAEAGEFTKRAFLNGRMDLTQAEAVIDLIESETQAAAQNAAGQLRGAVGLKLGPVYDSLLDSVAHFHAVIDYPDEDIDDFRMQGYLSALRNAEEALARLLSTFERGRVLREGVPTAIIGRPNTGKSSLLNALLGYDRAIVTEIAGTTRDTIEEKALVGGVLLRLTDTAGLRDTDDAIEKLGVSRTLSAISSAGLVILVLDGSEPLRDEDHDALRSIPQNVPCIVALNKSDLPRVFSPDELSLSGYRLCHVSALTGDGLDDLDAEIKRSFPELASPPSGEIITNARQAEAISRAWDSVGRAVVAISESVTPDAVLTEVESALSAIGEITGKTMREDITSRIFERFCVGK